MAAHIITELDAQLASLNQLKPPGASKNKIGSITQLCVSNIQAESNIVQSLYRALKKAPVTHKLGALYVIDSVVRQWIEKAKQSGQDLHVGGRGEPGTYGAAVKRVTELMPALFDDIVKGIPAEQSSKLANVVNIWDKGSTFPAQMLADFKERLAASPASSTTAAAVKTDVNLHRGGAKFMAAIPSRPVHTPLGFPPQHLYGQGLLQNKGEAPPTNASAPAPLQTPGSAPVASAAVTAPPADVNSILAALASAIPKPGPAMPQPAAPAAAPAPPPPQLPPAALQQLPPEIAALFGQQQFAPATPNAAAAAPPALSQGTALYNAPPHLAPYQNLQYQGYPPQPPPSIPQQMAMAPPPPQAQPPPPASDPLAPIRGLLPANIQNDPTKLMQALNLLNDLQKQSVHMQEWGPILQAFAASDAPAPGGQNGHARGRDRSRSPDRGRHGGRGSPVYAPYESNLDDRRNQYRQRSPIGMRDHISTSGTAMNGMPMQPKYITTDHSLPPNHIKVLSRTLFVGGANGSQQEIQQLFERFGRVQTCIANRDKRHAFVKMVTRDAALAAKHGMEELQSRNDREVMAVARQTKWGVGFGPRDCCDYQKGESIIPIDKLTDADMKWLLSAEYGGTGGRPVVGGMCLEEPDIEIGAGVSSKAMSKRVGPEHGSQNNHNNPNHHAVGKRGHRKDEGGGGRRGRGRDLDGAYAGSYGGGGGNMEHFPRPEPVAVATPPAVPNFGFMIPGQPQQHF